MAQTNLLTRTLGVVEWTTIGVGLVTALVLVGTALRDAPARDTAAPVLGAPSACTGASGTLATLRAYLDGAELPAEPTAPPPAVDDALRARGATLFAEHCATCHGTRGDGTGPTARQLAHAPADLTLGVYELRTTEHDALPTDADLFRTITRGMHGTGMPPWFALPERDRWALVAYIKTLSKAFSDDEAPPPVDVSHRPATTEPRIARGRELFASAGCASCHGPGARGDGPAATALSYKSGARARPRDLRVGPFHRGTRIEDLYLTLATGLDGTPMASFASVLAPDELWDVSMYVQTITPPVTTGSGGVRCLHVPDELRCVELPEGKNCLDPIPDADELVGIRALLHSHPVTP